MKAVWFRSWHGAPTDGKWRMVAADVGCKPAEVVALVWTLMDHASANEDRGSVKGFNARVYALDSGTDAATVRAILDALASPDVEVLADDRFINWDKHQPKREDGSAERARDWRERKRTQANAGEQERTLEGEERREEETTPTAKAVGEGAKRASRLSSDFVVPQDWLRWAAEDRRWSCEDVLTEAASFVDYWSAKAGRDGAKLDWQATWRNWCRNSRRPIGEGPKGAGAYARRPDG